MNKSRKFISFTTLGVLFFLTFQSAAAQNASMDGIVQAASLPQYEILESFSKTGTPLSKVQSAKVAYAITTDKQISTAERDLLAELTRTDIQYVTTSGKFGQQMSVPIASSEGAVILSYLLATKKFDSAKQWTRGPEGLAFLGVHYHVYPATRNYIIKGIVKDLMAADKASNVNNAYGPLRAFLQSYKNDIKTLPQFEKAAASQMMYDIVSQLNARKAQGRKIPGFVYSHFDNPRHAALLP